MNIVFFDLAGPNYPGGCEKYFANLTSHFSSTNKTIFIYSTQFCKFIDYLYHFILGSKLGSVQYVKRDIGKTVKFDMGISSLIGFTKNNQQIKKILNEADIIYAKNEFQELMLLYILLGKRQYAQKVIIGVHSAIFVPDIIKGIWKSIHDFQYKSFLYKTFLQSANSIHIINSDYKNLLVHTYNVNRGKIVYIPYFIDWNTQIKETERKKSFTILWAGRLTQQKGVDRLQKIIEDLSIDKNFDQLEILIAGQGDINIEQILNKYNNVKFLKYVHNMNKIYKKIDLAIVTSYFETFGYNVLEPQSYGIPVIAFDIVGPRDIIIDGKTGYLVKTTAEFVEKIKLFCQKNNTILSKDQIYQIINKHFSKTSILQKLDQELFYKS